MALIILYWLIIFIIWFTAICGWQTYIASDGTTSTQFWSIMLCFATALVVGCYCVSRPKKE